MLGCCGQIARRWHCLGAQVFVFLAKDKGDSLRVTTLADEKKVRSFTACACTPGGLTPDVVQKGSERRFRSLCGRIRISLARSAAFWTGFECSARESLGKYRWCSRSLTIDLLQTRASHDQCGKALPHGEYSESSTHVQAVLPTVGLAESACGYDCEQLLLALDHSEELFPKFRTPTSLMVQVKNKTQNWAILWHWLFGIKACDWARPHSAGSGADDYVWRK